MSPPPPTQPRHPDRTSHQGQADLAPRSQYARIDGLASLPRLPPAIMKARACILHYLGGGGVGGPSVSEEERTTQLQARYDRRNAARRSAFAKTNVAPEWICNDLELATAWALDHSITITETAARRHHRLDGELAKIGEEWSLSDCSTNAGAVGSGQGGPPHRTTGGGAAPPRATVSRRTRLSRPSGAFRRCRDNDDDENTDGNCGAACQGGHAYEVVYDLVFFFLVFS